MQAFFGFGQKKFYIWPDQAWQQWVRGKWVSKDLAVGGI